jgi:hypothetical protein
MAKPQCIRPRAPRRVLLLPPSPIEWFVVNRILFILLELPAEIDLKPSGHPADTRIPLKGWV